MRIVATVFGIAMGLLTTGDALAAKNSNRIEGKGTAAQAWALIGDFCGVTAWHPAIAKCETSVRDGARIRTLTAKEGAVFVEKLAKWDDEGRLHLRDPRKPAAGQKLRLHAEGRGGRRARQGRDYLVVHLRTQGRVGGRGPQGRRGCLSGGMLSLKSKLKGK